MTHDPISVLFAGGGTGGHVCPAVAVARALSRRAPGSRVLFLGTGRPVEKRILGRAGMPHVALASAPATSWRNVPWAVVSNARGLLQAVRATCGFWPDVVLGLGGYASAPGVLAGRALGARVALFEPNATPGRATSFLARFASEVYVHWEEGARGVRTSPVVTGTPLNDSAIAPPEVTKEAARWVLGLPLDRPVVLVVGGSQGARALNRWALEALEKHRDQGVSFVHVSGPEDEAAVRAAYAKAGVSAHVAPFFDSMAAAYRAANVVVCRSGAATLAEVTAEGLPAVAVPYPRAALDHQRANARAFEIKGGGKLLEEDRLSPFVFEEVVALAQDEPVLAELGRAARAQARPEAADQVADRLLALASSGRVEIAEPDARERARAADKDIENDIEAAVAA